MLRLARQALGCVLLSCLFSLSLAAQTYYLKGDPADQANKITANTIGTATFDTSPPTGAAPITQTGSPATNEDFVGNGLGIYWSGPFSGSVSGVLDLRAYWSTANPETIALGGAVQITLFADPDYAAASRVQPEKIIGRAIVPLTGISATPALIATQIPVSGTVRSTLLIQIVPQFVDAGEGVNVYYNATTTPSSFSFHAAPQRIPFPPAPNGSGIAPRYTVVTPTAAQIATGLGTDAGEPSIGVNTTSGNVFFQSFTTTFRVQFNDSCPASPSSTWVTKQSPITGTESMDPILYTDQATQRTFVSQLVLGTTRSLMAFTDNDGELWLPSQGAGIASGIDHQTLGGGPFHRPLLGGAFYPTAVYYCAQDIALANCAISLDGGVNFGPAVPIYTSQQCGGLHGHVKVGPDGTAYVPNKDCGGRQAVVASEDNGATWSVRKVPNSLAANSDPSLGISKNGRLYLAFADNDNHPVVAVSNDRGNSWTNVKDVGASAGINNVVFSEAVAGDDDRAAMAFLGTTSIGSLQSRTFPGVWYMYVASTFDGGNSWQLVNATPNDPVQRGPIWLKGGGEVSRNMLDFNDATIDRDGRLLVAFADGCIGACSQSPNAARGNSYSQIASIVRQSGGRRMYGQFDPPATATAPGSPLLTITRNGNLSKLTWSESNDGGSPVTKYSVSRDGTLIANTSQSSYTDPSGDPSRTYNYSVTATNAIGTSCGNNAVAAAPTGSSCVLPGVTMITDPTGDGAAAANPALDIQSVSIAEPYYADGSQKVIFTMKVASLASVPAGAEWRVLWSFPTTPNGSYYAEMHTDKNGVVGFAYGTIDVTGAVVTSVGQPHPLGACDAESTYLADGTIRLVISSSKIGSPAAGDLFGGLLARTFITTGSVVTTSRTAIDTASTPNAYAVVGNAFCAPKAVTCLEDDDPHIAYSRGWHTLASQNASAGHFRLGGGTPSAKLTFTVPVGKFGAITYNYAKSPRGGLAEIFLDGVSQGAISYAGSSGKLRDPQFGFNVRYPNLQPGSHTLEVRARGNAYVDGFCLESSASNSMAPTGPGTTSQTNTTLPGLTEQLVSITVPANATSISLLVESSSGLVNVVLLDPAGLTLATADTSSGVAVIDQAVSGGGIFLAKLISANAGPVDVTVLSTPTVNY
jgi:hypothetical protein